MLKRVFLYVCINLLAATVLLSNELSVTAELSEAKVYLTGAELTHTAKIKLKSGTCDLIIENLASNINPNSINVSLSGGVVIMSVGQRFDYLQEEENPPIVKKLEDSIEILNNSISEKNNEIQALDAEADLIMSNKVISGKDKNITAADLKLMSEFFHTRLLEIKNNKLKLSNSIKKLNDIVARINNQLAEINSKKNKTVNEIIITVNTSTAQSADLKLTYFVNNAGWSPLYDVRVKDINSPVEFHHKANVWQNTGLDWSDVKLTISTRNPMLSGNYPILNPVHLDFADTYQRRQDLVGKQNTISSAPSEGVQSVVGLNSGVINSGGGFNIRGSRAAGTEISEDDEDISNPVPGQTNSKLLSVEFKPDLSYTIPSDGKVHLVELQENSIAANYEYYTVPKLATEAYLIAKISNWESINLLAGPANIYFENSFIGQTRIDPDVTIDTLTLSLGLDKNIIISRDIIKDFTESKFLSSDIERTFAYKISIKNAKKNKVKVNLEDLVPVSRNEDIQVKLIDGTGSELEKETGKVKWTLELEPDKSIEKKLIFSVRHPKNRKVSNF